MRRSLFLALILPLALAACGEGKAPSEKLKDATRQLVEEASGEAPPRLAEGPYAPRDECVGLPGADAFRARLAQAVEARDADALVALAAPDVKLDFGGGAGAEELRDRLADDDLNLWAELDALLAMGCAADGVAMMTMPWYFAQEIDAVDPMMGMIVTGEGVPLRLKPDAGSDMLEPVSWDVVELVDGWKPDAPFQHVATTEGKRGYIATGSLRSLIDYRLLASSRNGEWSIVMFAAGD